MVIIKIGLVKVIIRLVEEVRRLGKGMKGIKVIMVLVIMVVAIIGLAEVDLVKATQTIVVVGFRAQASML